MALNRKIRYQELYPEASDEILAVLKKSDRKMEYQEYDLKVERSRIDETGAVTYTPSREDSLDRLLEENVQFRAEIEDVADSAIKAVMLEKLHLCLSELTPKELTLIKALFFQEMSEREYSKISGIPQKTVHNRKHRILGQLKKLIENKK